MGLYVVINLFFKNDLAEYFLTRDGCDYDNENNFNEFLARINKITDIFKKMNNILLFFKIIFLYFYLLNFK